MPGRPRRQTGIQDGPEWHKQNCTSIHVRSTASASATARAVVNAGKAHTPRALPSAGRGAVPSLLTLCGQASVAQLPKQSVAVYAQARLHGHACCRSWHPVEVTCIVCFYAPEASTADLPGLPAQWCLAAAQWLHIHWLQPIEHALAALLHEHCTFLRYKFN
jgi:glycine/D-amino acid oxidase-like deaminating enzyme